MQSAGVLPAADNIQHRCKYNIGIINEKLATLLFQQALTQSSKHLLTTQENREAGIIYNRNLYDGSTSKESDATIMFCGLPV